MNTLDMHTREKVNKIHIAEMHREARERSISRDLKSAKIPPVARARIRILVVSVVLVLLVGIFLISRTVF